MNIVITGATKGIGRAIAEKFAKAAFTIFACARNERELQQMQQDLQQQYTDCKVYTKVTDVASKEDVLAFGHWVLETGGAPDILINNAGTFTPGSILEEADGALEQMMTVNLYGAYHLTRLLLPEMVKKRSGHVFNICSIASLNAYDNGGSYSITKFALYGFSKNLREQMKPHNIKVTSVLPGATWSASWEGSGVEPKRMMEANDIAEMIFSCSQLSPQAVVEDIILRPQLGDL